MNPVYTAEIRYQNYVIRTNRSSNISILLALLMLIPALIAAVVFTVAVGFLHTDLPPVPIFSQMQTPGDVLYTIGAVALLTMNLAHYLVVWLISSGLAVFSIQREKRNGTWDLLVITRLTARQISMGKIGASLWVLRRDIAIVTVLRVGLLAFALDFVRPAYQYADYNTGQFVLVGLFVIWWTALDMILAVSLAVASTLAPQGRSTLLPLVVLGRLVTLFAGVWWMGRIVDALYNDPASAQYALIGALGIAVLGILAVFSLKIAEYSAQFAHASPRKLSQALSQASQSIQGQGLDNIPTVSQM